MRNTQYAGNTTVTPESSQREILSVLRKYGANKFGTMEDEQKAYIMFGLKNLMIQIAVDLPRKEDYETTDTGRQRKNTQVNQVFEQAIRQRWRSLCLLVKAKLVGVTDGITTIEKEFMGDIVMPDGKTLSMKILPQIERMAQTGEMPKLLGMM